jgi:tetratricopeptide (TPR) repeat protein
MGFTLTWAGKPKEGIEYLNKWIRLDPRARYRYLRWTSWAHFWMGETAEAANLSEQALRLNPENLSAAVELAGFYGALGRDQDARAMLEIRKKGALPPDELWQVLRQNPFSDRTVADRYARGLLKAGLPPGKVSGGYFPAFKENQLTGEEIKKLLFGSKITGINLSDGQQWWTDHKKNGECTWRGSGPISSDTGMSRIEGDMICFQYQKRLWALEYCGTVFRNPGGKHGSKDEYFLCSDIGPIPFSLVK